ncbi:MAG: leucine-rich repeat protein [Oscillospiraceae bacterium]|nr:leucine-rich repeat protein [Oscillospiraceae bacterium]
MKIKKIAAYIMSVAMLSASTGYFNIPYNGMVNASEIISTDVPVQAVLTYVTKDDGGISVTGCSNLSEAQDIIIPEKIDGSPVTSVAEKAFYGCVNVCKIELGKNIKTIGSEAFYGSEKIMSVTVPESVESIGEYAFGYTTKCMIPPGLMTMFDQPVINNGFTVYGSTSAAENYVTACMEDNKFYETIQMNFVPVDSEEDMTGKVQKVTDSITCVLDENNTLTLSGTGSLEAANKPWLAYTGKVEKIIISDAITDVPEGMFTYCKNTQDIELPDSIAVIGDNAFRDFTKLKTVKMPESMSSIGTAAFNGCLALETISLSQSITGIPAELFSGCKALKKVIIPDTVSSIGEAAFSGCESLTDINMPAGITDLRNRTFMNCSSLSQIQFPESVFSIGEECFKNCTSLKNADFPEKIRTIRKEAFMGCSELESISLPDTFSVFDRGVFAGCSKLVLDSYPESVKIIFSGCFDDDASVPLAGDEVLKLDDEGNLLDNEPQAQLSFDVQDDILTIGGTGVIAPGNISIPEDINLSSVEKIIIADGITGISKDNFKDADLRNVKTIEIADSVRYIGPSAFENSSSEFPLASLNLGKGVVYTGTKAFSIRRDNGEQFDCEYPASLLYIDDYSFIYTNTGIILGALSAENISVPSSVCVIGKYAIAYQNNTRRSTESDRFRCVAHVISSTPNSEAELYCKYNNIKFNPVNSEGTVSDTEGKPHFGDIDNNTVVEMTDLTMLSQYLMQDIELTEEQLACADVINDNDINLADLCHLKQYIIMEKVTLGFKPQ